MSEAHERAMVGSAVALAAGDCLGAALEGRPPPPEPVRDFVHDPTIWTDDTQQALVLIEATVRLGKPEPEWVANRYLELGLGRLHRRTGRGFRGAVEAFGRSRDWRTSGRADRAGNGAAMRIAPVAVTLAVARPDEWWRDVVAVSLVTHREIRALAGALAVGWAAARLAAVGTYPLGEPRGRELVAELSEWLREREAWLAGELPADWGAPLAHEAGERHQVSEALARLTGAPRDTRGFVLGSVVTSVYLALTSDAGFEETLVRAVNLGGDADTVGAMVGGMAGAAVGPDAVPRRWLRMPGAEELRLWAEALAGSGDVDSLPDLYELESRLCRLRYG